MGHYIEENWNQELKRTGEDYDKHVHPERENEFLKNPHASGKRRRCRNKKPAEAGRENIIV